MLLANKAEGLAKFTKVVKVPEMIISTLFLLTGIYMLTQVPVIHTMLIIKIVIVFASIPLAIVGFKKGNKILAVISLIMIIAAYGLAEMSKKQKVESSGVPTEAASTIGGHEIFMAECAKCHGEDGKLRLMDSPDLSASTMDLNSRIEIIKNGKGAMQGFGHLNDEQVKAVAEYTESLKK